MGRATLAAGWCLRSGPCCDQSSSPCSRLRSPPRRPRRPSSTSPSRPRGGAASAAVIDIAVTPAGGDVLGESQTVTGKLTGPYGAPLVGRSVVLEARPYPFKHHRFEPVETAKSGLDGRFALDHPFDRNQQLRVFAPEFGDRSFVLPAYVFPRTALTFGLVRRNVIRLVQTYRTPKNIRLTAPTLFYVGRKNKQRAPLVAKVKTRPVRAKGK